ncbi:uncharacterized protein LOC111698662 isoform X2 [Eurytemora carolleeae]|uniref:uncharacterized protein LOC111698662 isoform X2 n=1 Tax=Eurytemora carolleeae TaxID=1294199 RepID=UPI000C75E2D4|nr:uncharacterized protein LOC111698662 isoform X2 [Eurytemora carolleeae]|eukprot:XP_023324824.1 uncharacterized protein LOC111698662 isoform X2 [Eurytemora affinis]
MLGQFKVSLSIPVHKDHCSNSCWDTVFKAGYETGAGTYKHIYFNATLQTWIIWTFTLIYVIAVYESIKYILTLMIREQLRRRMVFLFLSSVYPHYYGWWCIFNYFNDDFYSQLLHQSVFTITEVVCTLMVLHLADRGVQATPQRLVFIITIAASHVVVSGWDQFVSNVLLQEGELHQVLRDLGFMLPDVLHILFSVKELKIVGQQKRVPASYLISNQLALSSLAYIAGFWILLLIL